MVAIGVNTFCRSFHPNNLSQPLKGLNRNRSCFPLDVLLFMLSPTPSGTGSPNPTPSGRGPLRSTPSGRGPLRPTPSGRGPPRSASPHLEEVRTICDKASLSRRCGRFGANETFLFVDGFQSSSLFIAGHERCLRSDAPIDLPRL